MAKSVRLTEHAILKLEILKNHGFDIERGMVEKAVRTPTRILVGYDDRKIAEIGFDAEHVIRVVFEERSNEKVVITVYPGRRERYEQD